MEYQQYVLEMYSPYIIAYVIVIARVLGIYGSKPTRVREHLIHGRLFCSQEGQGTRKGVGTSSGGAFNIEGKGSFTV